MKERFLMMTERLPTDTMIQLASEKEIEIVYRGLPLLPWQQNHLDVGEGFAGVITDHPVIVANMLPHLDVGIFYPLNTDYPASLAIWRSWRARVDLLANRVAK